MMEYDIVGIHHVSGAKHQVADCLSRFPTSDYDPTEDEIQDVALMSVDAISIHTAQRADEEILEIINNLNNPSHKRLKVNFLLKDDVLFYRNSKHD
jgi:hypothetical protein